MMNIFPPGTHVILRGIQQRPELNGLRGVTIAPLDQMKSPARYMVHIKTLREVVSLRQENVVLKSSVKRGANYVNWVVKLMGWAAIFGTVVAVLLFGASYLALPSLSGKLTVRSSALTSDITIVRDGVGMPHVFAASARDAHFAAGFVHAQDRMWQMDMNRRAAKGRVSELIGASALPFDRMARTLGFHRLATASLPHQSAELREALEGYADGVNEWLAQAHWWSLPIESILMWAPRPEPWSAVDCLAHMKMLDFAASRSWGGELLLATLAEQLGEQRTSEIHPGVPSIESEADEEDEPAAAWDAAWTSGVGETLSYGAMRNLVGTATRLRELATAQHFAGVGVGPPSLGSSFAVSGVHTEDGAPIIASVASAGHTTPSPWYLIELSVAGASPLHVSGATLPGAGALIFAGQNGAMAWGITGGGGDTQDVYVERIRNDAEYEVRDGEWRALVSVREEIRIKGRAEPEIWHARSTRHGPLLSDVDLSVERSPTLGFALRWTGVAHDGVDRSPSIIEGLTRTRSWSDFVDTLDAADASYGGPHLGFTLTSAARVDGTRDAAGGPGTIAYTEVGNLPIRIAGHTGSLPVAGWRGDELEWRGFVPAPELPRIVNPARGFVVAAAGGISGASAQRRQIIALIEQSIAEGEADPDERICAQVLAEIQRNGYSPRAEALAPSIVLTLRGPASMRIDAKHRIEIADRRKLATDRSNLAYDLLLVQSPHSRADNKNVLHQLLRMAMLQGLHSWEDYYVAADSIAPTVFATFERRLTHGMLYDDFFVAALGTELEAEAESSSDAVGKAAKRADALLASVAHASNDRVAALVGAAITFAASEAAASLVKSKGQVELDVNAPDQPFMHNFRMPDDLMESVTAWRAARATTGAEEEGAEERGEMEESARAWCDDLRTLQHVESCGEQVQSAFEATIAELERRFGGATAEWKWGAVHAAAHTHVPLSLMYSAKTPTWAEWPMRTLQRVASAVIELTARPAKGGGSDGAVATTFARLANESLWARRGATVRTIIGMAEGGYGITSTGQSGQWRSAHFDDHIARFDSTYPRADFASLDIHTSAHTPLGRLQRVLVLTSAKAAAAKSDDEAPGEL